VDAGRESGGLEHRPPYALRHSFAAWSIAAGIGLFELARMMGTSVEQIDRTYGGHLLPDSIDRARDALERFGHGMDTKAAGNAYAQ
jgi:integrase